jgi:iron(III) transport system permease protein
MNWTLLQNSLLVSVLASLLSVGIGFLAALWMSALESRWRNRMLLAAVVALVLPPFLVTNCWLYLLGFTGVLKPWLPLSIYSLGGTVWILALLTWPISLLFVLGAWQRLEPAQLEADTALTGVALIRWLLWPLAKAAVGQAAVLTFVLALNNFAVPALLQTKVYPAEVWVSFNTTFDSIAALKLSLPLIVAPLILVLWFRNRKVAWPQTEGWLPASLFRRQLGAGCLWLSGIATAIVLVLAVGLPLIQLGSSAKTWTELAPALAASRSDVLNSFVYAVTTATLCLALALVSWRWPLGWILWVPFLVPGVLLGIAMIVALNRPVFSAIYQGAGVIILAFTARYLAISWNGVARAMRTVDRDITEAAQLDGATRWQLLRHVQWPQISAQLAAAWYVIYLLCLWDVETLVLIVPPGGETLAVRIFNLLHYGHNSQVNALCLVLLALGVLPLFLWQASRWVQTRLGTRAADFGENSSRVDRPPYEHQERSKYVFSAQRGLVAQVCNLPYRRFVIGRASERKSALALADVPQNEYVFNMVGTSRCDVRAACSGATLSNGNVARIFLSARYYAGGDGAARHPYHRAKHIPSVSLAERSLPAGCRQHVDGPAYCFSGTSITSPSRNQRSVRGSACSRLKTNSRVCFVTGSARFT